MSMSGDISDEFGFHIGGGVEAVVVKQVELFAEFRYTILTATMETSMTASAPGLPPLTMEDEDEISIDHGLLRAGVSWIF